MHNKQTPRLSGARTRRHQEPVKKSRSKLFRVAGVALILALVIGAVAYGVSGHGAKSKTSTIAVASKSSSTKSISPPANPTQKTTATVKSTSGSGACSSNGLSQLLIVSISQQHLWACNGTSQAYDSAVVTGMELYPADLTPTGTYHIYAKETNQTLTGHDSTGSWSDPVSYWMPFLDNEYGEYGFHDATWRAPGDFGNININNPYTDAEHGSHGCVELPLATAAWIYNWSVVGTTVTIES